MPRRHSNEIANPIKKDESSLVHRSGSLTHVAVPTRTMKTNIQIGINNNNTQPNPNTDNILLASIIYNSKVN